MVFYSFRLLDMRKFFTFLITLSGLVVTAQTGLYNSGNIRIHDEGKLGFHTNLINDSSFDTNLGLAGFYGSSAISVSGAFVPVFFDTEIANDGSVDLLTSLNSLNNTNFVVGDFRTPRAQPDISFNFIDDAFFVGEGDPTKIDGYATISGIRGFTFPVGDAINLRTLSLNSEAVNSFARCAYFFENPNNPSLFPGFNTALRPRDVAAISTLEFWHLEGNELSTVTLSWNRRSAMATIAANPGSITVVGWNISEGRWTDLGNVAVNGDLDSGFVTSFSFVPNDYAILTLGSLAEPVELLTLDNYMVTPNSDGINDFLEIQELIDNPNNSIRIFDRRGLKVFEMENYTNEFNGFSNQNNLVFDRDVGLPDGVYFYLITLNDLGLNYQGFLYLGRPN